MFGNVLSYSIQTGEGAISGDDGHRYRFTSHDWNGTEVPRRDTRVEFAPTNGNATSIYPVASATGQPNGGPSALPAVAAGCGAGCVAYFVLVIILFLAIGIGLRGILSPDSEDRFFSIIPTLIALVTSSVVGYLVYRAVRNRRR